MIYNVTMQLCGQQYCRVTYCAVQVLELCSQLVQFCRCEQDHVEHLYHQRGKGEVLFRVKDLGQRAVDRVGIHIDTEQSEYWCVCVCLVWCMCVKVVYICVCVCVCGVCMCGYICVAWCVRVCMSRYWGTTDICSKQTPLQNKTIATVVT